MHRSSACTFGVHEDCVRAFEPMWPCECVCHEPERDETEPAQQALRSVYRPVLTVRAEGERL